MTKPKALHTHSLYTPCDLAQLRFETTDELEDLDGVVGQARALDSVQFGIRIRGEGYNVFALGPSGMGKFTAVRQVINREATNRPTPSDWCYVNNFEEPHKPKALQLPPGQGRCLRRDMEQLIEELGTAIPAAFESEDYHARAEALEEELKERQSSAMNKLQEQAKEHHIALIHTPAGFALAPMSEKDEVISPDEFEKLSEAEKQRLQKVLAELQEQLQKILHRIPVWRKETREKIKTLNQEIARRAVSHLIDALKKQYAELAQVLGFLDAVQQDIIKHVDEFRGERETPIFASGPGAHTAALQRYKVNLLVDHSEQQAAPVFYEDLPTHANLIGRSEYQAHMGTLVTDFNLIKPGALHRANGGYLLLDARKLLMQPFAWDSLKRTLKSREIRIESLERILSLISTTTLEPEPIPLDVKVILVGERLLYYLLNAYDPEFRDLFKVAADFEETIDRGPEANLLYARLIATLARREGLRPLERGAVVRLIEQCARLAEDAEKLCTHLRSVTDLLRESDYWAGQAQRQTISGDDVQQALNEQIHRADRLRQQVYEAIHRGTILIDTRGTVVGQVNGLSVIDLGNFRFAQPARITATTRLGEGKVIDIERETELGGAIHSKGVLILSSFLASRYARDYPLSIAASLVFEQSYGIVEGDSASLAELCALLSALAELPVRQSLAITGSVNQHGQVQPIGAVNEKIEGFFDVCKAAALTGEQGVLIPTANVKNLMLRQDVVQAAGAGNFHIYAVDTVDQAIELLTDVAAGERDSEGRFPDNSVNGHIEKRLAAFSAIRRSFQSEDRDNEIRDEA